jgi:ATP-dependent Lon protease
MSLKLPLLPLRDVVVYPQMVVPLFVGREKSIRALDAAMADDKQILLVAQTQADVDDPSAESLYPVGTVSSILQMLRLPDGTVKVLVEGGQRANVLSIDAYENDEGEESYLDAEVELIAEPASGAESSDDAELISVLNNQFEQYVKLSKKSTCRGAFIFVRH